MKRWIAYKLLISDIWNSDFNEEGFLEFGEVKVIRVNVVGTIVSKYLSEDGKFAVLTIDDGTDTIGVREFNEIQFADKFEVGDIVRVIGRLRKYEDEIYITPEIIKKVDPNFEIMQKLEEIRNRPIFEKGEEIIIEENIVENPKEDILNKIREMDKGEGVDVEELAKTLNIDEITLNDILRKLMDEGDIYEPRAGRVKLLG